MEVARRASLRRAWRSHAQEAGAALVAPHRRRDGPGAAGAGSLSGGDINAGKKEGPAEPKPDRSLHFLPHAAAWLLR